MGSKQTHPAENGRASAAKRGHYRTGHETPGSAGCVQIVIEQKRNGAAWAVPESATVLRCLLFPPANATDSCMRTGPHVRGVRDGPVKLNGFRCMPRGCAASRCERMILDKA